MPAWAGQRDSPVRFAGHPLTPLRRHAREAFLPFVPSSRRGFVAWALFGPAP
jgi:hypothetical protein